MKLKSELFLKLNIKLKKKGLKKLEQKKRMHKKPKKNSNFKNISSVISFCVHMYFYLKINFEVSSLKKVKIHKMMPNNFYKKLSKNALFDSTTTSTSCLTGKKAEISVNQRTMGQKI